MGKKMTCRSKRTALAVLVLLAAIICAELFCRFALGMCDAPLFRSDADYEYIPQANQDRYRFFCRYRTNAYCQRSEAPDSTKKRILGLGDSVLYGGTSMDQDSLATTIFSLETGMQMLNVSAGSWGPDNCAAYLRKHGTFGASAMVLVCSSHDAYDVMTFAPVVGVYPTFPDRQYKCGLWELLDRYLVPKMKFWYNSIAGPADAPAVQYADPDAQVARRAANRQVLQKGLRFNPGFDELKHIADSCGIPFAIYLHPETGELAAGAYNDMGKEIIHWADTAGVHLVVGISTETADMYRDCIHLNGKGQRHLADELKKIIGGFY